MGLRLLNTIFEKIRQRSVVERIARSLFDFVRMAKGRIPVAVSLLALVVLRRVLRLCRFELVYEESFNLQLYILAMIDCDHAKSVVDCERVCGDGLCSIWMFEIRGVGGCCRAG